MERKTYVKCKYCEVYADVIVGASVRYRQHRDTVERMYDKIVTGEFSAVSWDDEKRELRMRKNKKTYIVCEFDDRDFYLEGIMESTEHVHVATWIEYLAIDNFVVIDEMKQADGEET